MLTSTSGCMRVMPPDHHQTRPASLRQWILQSAFWLQHAYSSLQILLVIENRISSYSLPLIHVRLKSGAALCQHHHVYTSQLFSWDVWNVGTPATLAGLKRVRCSSSYAVLQLVCVISIPSRQYFDTIGSKCRPRPRLKHPTHRLCLLATVSR
jgi:hypothetical protein